MNLYVICVVIGLILGFFFNFYDYMQEKQRKEDIKQEKQRKEDK